MLAQNNDPEVCFSSTVPVSFYFISSWHPPQSCVGVGECLVFNVVLKSCVGKFCSNLEMDISFNKVFF